MATPKSAYPRPSRESLAAFNQLLKAKRWLAAAIGSVVIYAVVRGAILTYLESARFLDSSYEFTLFNFITNVGLISALLCGWAVGTYAKAMGLPAIVLRIVSFVVSAIEINGRGIGVERPPGPPENPIYAYHLLLWAIYFALQFHINRQLKLQYNLKQVWLFRNPKEIRSIQTQLADAEKPPQPPLGINLQNPQS